MLRSCPLGLPANTGLMVAAVPARGRREGLADISALPCAADNVLVPTTLCLKFATPLPRSWPSFPPFVVLPPSLSSKQLDQTFARGARARSPLAARPAATESRDRSLPAQRLVAAPVSSGLAQSAEPGPFSGEAVQLIRPRRPEARRPRRTLAGRSGPQYGRVCRAKHSQ